MRVMIGRPNDFDPLLDPLSPQHQKRWDYVADYLEGWLRPLSPMPPAATTHWGQTRLPSLCPLTYCLLHTWPTETNFDHIVRIQAECNALCLETPAMERNEICLKQSSVLLLVKLSNWCEVSMFVDYWYKSLTFAFGQEDKIDNKIKISTQNDIQAIHNTWLWI